METPNSFKIQTQTLEALNNFMRLWTNDPFSLDNSLTITRNTVLVYNDTDVITLLQLPIEIEPEPAMPPSSIENILDDYFPYSDLDNLVPPSEMLLQELTPSLLSSEPDYPIRPLKEDTILSKLLVDMTEEKTKVFARCNPLTGRTNSEKLQEITTRLKEESRGKNRDYPIRILEATYYLEQLRNSLTDKQEIQKIKATLRQALGPRRATRM